MPLLTLPIALSFLSDALVALGRISGFLLAEELPEMYRISYSNKWAISVDADFTWEIVAKLSKDMKTENLEKHDPSTKSEKDGKGILPIDITEIQGSADSDSDSGETKEQPFVLNNLSLEIERGAFVAIVGRVGSGKVCPLLPLLPPKLQDPVEFFVASPHRRNAEDKRRST